jgi:hypothetical protein
VDLVSRDVPLSRGWFGGATARVVIGPRATTPHLWVAKDCLLLTVAGSASVKELTAIAESMQPYSSGPTP